MTDEKKDDNLQPTWTMTTFKNMLEKEGLNIKKFLLLFATLLVAIFLFATYISNWAALNTTFGNKLVMVGLTMYITILFCATDLIPSSSPSKKWFSITCRLLTLGTLYFSITYFR
jgi:uncharacterized membrane protein